MTKDDRIEGAKLIVEWMPDWEIKKDEISGAEKIKIPVNEMGSSYPPISYLWTDRNLQAEVLDEIEKRDLKKEYLFNLEEISGIEPRDDVYENVWIVHTADPETIFDAIVKVLEGEVE
jgi:hypothetical protein